MADRPRGARPTPRNRLAAAIPHRAAGTTPVQFLRLPQRLSDWLNFSAGDCVTAEEAFAKACGGVYINDSVVKSWATAHDAMNGAYLDQVLDWMHQAGFTQDGNTYNDGSKVSVDYANGAVLQSAIYQGPVKIGVAAGQLEKVVGNVNGWFGLGFTHDAAEDHCVSLCGHGTLSWLAQQLGVEVPPGVDGTRQGYALFTWNTVGIIDVPSMLAITGEAWLRTPTTQVLGSNTPTPDTVVVTSDPGPGPTPPPVPPIPPMPVPGPTPLFTKTFVVAAFAGQMVQFRLPVNVPAHSLLTVTAPATDLDVVTL